MKHYPYQEDTWRWGIPEQQERFWWRVVAAIMVLLSSEAPAEGRE